MQLWRLVTTGLLMFCSVAFAEAQATPMVTKIEPPNWWAGLPKPMLLMRGEHLEGAKLKLSDPTIRIEKLRISANGHWAEVWLSASPTQAESVTFKIQTSAGEVSVPFRFERKRAAGDGAGGFSSRDAMYLIMTDRFADGELDNDGASGTAREDSEEAAAERAKPRGWHGGDLRGVLRHLDYIQQLGFTTVWLTPVTANEHETDSYHGYGATDMYAVDPHFGSIEDLKALSDELHRRHMKLVLDTVPNHVGPKHPWVDDEPDPAWLHGTKENHDEAVGDFRPLVDPHASWRDQQDVLQGWFANVLPDLNQENPATAQYLIENAMWWVEEAGADGLRIDTFPYVRREFWQEFHAQLHNSFPRLTDVGEVFNCDATITSAFADGVTRNGVDTGLYTPFDFPSYCALRDVFLMGAPMSRLKEVWRLDALYPHPERLVPFLGNHDTSRFASETTPETMRLASAVLLTMRGMPEVYAGDEIAMTGGDDPDNRHDFPGGWPGAAQNAFANPTPEQAEMHDWVHELLALRRRYVALQDGTMQVLRADKDVLAYVRISATKGPHIHDQKVLVIVNRASEPATVELLIGGTALEGATEINSLAGNARFDPEKKRMRVEMPGAAVWIAAVR